MLHNLKRDQYLGKMENIRVEVFRRRNIMTILGRF